MSLYPFFKSARRIFDKFIIFPYYLKKIKSYGYGIDFGHGFYINHPECLSLGDNVEFNEGCWISVLKSNVQKNSQPIDLSPKVSIGSNTYIGRFATIACMDSVEIGKSVLISDRVYIGDCHHGFSSPDLAIKDQYMYSPGPVVIGDGAWIGINVAILPNVKIGRNCVVGANSVVTKDIPDYHIAAGNPAIILRSTLNQ